MTSHCIRNSLLPRRRKIICCSLVLPRSRTLDTTPALPLQLTVMVRFTNLWLLVCLQCASILLTSAQLCPEKCACSYTPRTRGSRNNSSGRKVVCAGMKKIPKSSDFPPDTSTLIIDQSSLQEVPTDAFQGIMYLQRLEMRDCGLSSIRPYAFRGPPRLNILTIQVTHPPVDETSFHSCSRVYRSLNQKTTKIASGSKDMKPPNLR